MQIRDLRQQMNEALNSTSPDAAQVGTIVIQQRSLRQQVQAVEQTFLAQALALLTEEQRQKVAQIQEAIRLAPQGRPLASLGLIQRPRQRPDGGFRLQRQPRFQGTR